MSYDDMLFGSSLIFIFYWAFVGTFVMVAIISLGLVSDADKRKAAQKPKNKPAVAMGYLLKTLFLALVGLNFYFANFGIMSIMVIQFILLQFVSFILKSEMKKYKD